jgi:hypothetical protein
MSKSDEIALRFTRRAEELRAIASNMKDPNTKDAMLKWADDYDRLAERAIELGTFGMPRKPAPPPQKPW